MGACSLGAGAFALVLLGCDQRRERADSAGSLLRGEVRGEVRGAAPVMAIDGSSTVFPMMQAVAEEFRARSKARLSIGVSGTGGGFQKFCSGETVITGASRPIAQSELEACRGAGVEYVELPVAYDGICVAVNPRNDWARHVTVSELRALWRPEAQASVQRWSDVRTGWPDEEIHLFGAGVASGTYDYFTLAIVGTEHASRGDFTSSEDDNVLVQGVSMDRLALGFFGYSYYEQNRSRLELLAIDDDSSVNGAGPVLPSPQTVNDGSYSPLSRPVFVYVSKAALARRDVDEFVHFFIQRAPDLAGEVGLIALPQRTYELVLRRYRARREGTVFGGSGARVGTSWESLLAAE